VTGRDLLNYAAESAEQRVARKDEGNAMKTPATSGAMTVRRADPKPRVVLPFRFLP